MKRRRSCPCFAIAPWDPNHSAPSQVHSEAASQGPGVWGEKVGRALRWHLRLRWTAGCSLLACHWMSSPNPSNFEKQVIIPLPFIGSIAGSGQAGTAGSPRQSDESDQTCPIVGLQPFFPFLEFLSLLFAVHSASNSITCTPVGSFHSQWHPGPSRITRTSHLTHYHDTVLCRTKKPGEPGWFRWLADIPVVVCFV